MNSDWKKLKQRHWPTGALNKFLKEDGSDSVLDALKKRINESPESERPAAALLEELNDESLVLATAGQIIALMHKLGVRRAERKVDREFDSGIPSTPKHPSVQDQEPGDV